MIMYEDIAIVSDGQAVVHMKGAGTSKGSDISPSKVVVNSKDKVANIASWGSSNDLPQKILKSVRKNGAATSGLSVMSDAHYGGGFVLFKEKFEDNSKGEKKRKLEQVSLSEHPEIKAFFRRNKMKRFFRETIDDLEYFAIGFPEYILSNDYNEITEVHRQKAAHCRFEQMDKDGYIKSVWVSGKWADGVDLESEYATEIKVIDSYWPADKVKEYCKENKIRKFVRPLFYTMLDESYYPVASWHSAYYSKWIDVANSIPEFKKALFENQVNIKYHIEVDDEYFKRKYQNSEKNWEDFSVEDQEKARRSLVEFIDQNLRGSKNAGTSIWSMIYKDHQGKPFPGIKITAIDDKLKDGAFLPDGTAANSEVLFAISVDPTLIGAGIPGGVSAGSGSDKRIAWTILSARCKPKRETTLECFEFIQEYNGWDDSLEGAFQDTILTTLDKNPTGSKKSVNI